MDPVSDKKLIANPEVILRQEFDDWAILFDPDTGNAFGVNPIGVLVWKHLDGINDTEAIIGLIRQEAADVPDNVADHVRDFMKTALDLGLAAYTPQ